MRQRLIAASVVGVAVLLIAGIGYSHRQNTSTSTTTPLASTPSTATDEMSSTTQPGSTSSSTSAKPGQCTGAKHTAGGPDGSGGCWPGPNNTGVPAGTQLTNYTGPCVITARGTVIDAKTVNCDLGIRAADVVIKRSKINGFVATDENSNGFSFSISDSEVSVGDRAGTGVGSVNFTATRVHVRGGNRSMHCWNNCTITDSYVHGQFRDNTGKAHESGIRMDQSLTLRHNSILCDAPEVPPDAGCSADLTGYGDFGVVQNNTIDHNLFLASTGGYCAYGGSASSKPFPDANHIVFTNNVFQRGTKPGDHGKPVCGYYGPITSFDPNQPGNVWKNNTWDDGAVLQSEN